MNAAVLTMAVLALLEASAALVVVVLVWNKVNADWPTEEHEKPVEAKERRKPILLFKPPMIDGMTMRDWLRYHWASAVRNGDEIWSRVVDEFYLRASQHPLVAPYFVGKDVAEIKKKFLATLLIVTHSGVTDVAAERLIELHKHLGITGDAYDATMNVLTDVLHDYGIPQTGTAQLIPMLKELRTGLVTA